MRLERDLFAARGRALEEAYYQNVDQNLLRDLRTQLAELEDEAKLAHISEIMDQNVLRDLVRIGVTAEALLAMRFVPMVRVAWADRKMSDAEKKAVLKAAETENIKPGNPAYELLRTWLDRPPEPAVFAAWTAYIHELARNMPPQSLNDLRDRMEGLCRRAAKAAGGVLGMGSISKVEQQVIDECLNSYKV